MKKGVLAPAEEQLRYAMSLPVATTVTGMDNLDVVEQNLKIAQGFQPLSASEMKVLRDRATKLPMAASSLTKVSFRNMTIRKRAWRIISR